MGEPLKIVDLAATWSRSRAWKLGAISTSSSRASARGEKLYEELFVPGETYARTRHEKIFIAANAGHAVPPDLAAQLSALGIAADQEDAPAMLAQLRVLVPEFQPARTPGTPRPAVIPLKRQPHA